VITSNPTVPEVHIARGMVLQSKNKHLEALGCYDDAVRLGVQSRQVVHPNLPGIMGAEPTVPNPGEIE